MLTAHQFYSWCVNLRGGHGGLARQPRRMGASEGTGVPAPAVPLRSRFLFDRKCATGSDPFRGIAMTLITEGRGVVDLISSWDR